MNSEEWRELVEVAEAVLEVLEIGTEPGLCHMDKLYGRVAWVDRMKPRREALRAALARDGGGPR